MVWPEGGSRPSRRQGFLGLAAELRERRFDVALLFTNSFRSALLARLAGIQRRIGYDREGRGLLLSDKLLPHKFDGRYVPAPMVRYYNAIARYLGCRDVPERPILFTTSEQDQVAAAAIEAAGVGADQPLVVISPGASYGPAKCWLPERFAEVGDRLARECRVAVFIACGPKEVEVARRVASRMKEKVTVLDNPVMRLGPLKALIRRASLLITNDTGPEALRERVWNAGGDGVRADGPGVDTDGRAWRAVADGAGRLRALHETRMPAGSPLYDTGYRGQSVRGCPVAAGRAGRGGRGRMTYPHPSFHT